MIEQVRKLGMAFGLSHVEKLLDKYAEGVLPMNPTLYDPAKKKYQSMLHTGMPQASASAPMPKVLPPIQI